MKKLFTYLLSICAIISCLQEERSPEEILVPTLAKVESTESSLMFTSKVPKGTEKLVEECGFYYGTDKSMADATKVEASMDVNNFAVELPERNYGTTYYICSYITNGHGSEIRSDVSSYSLKALDKYIDFEPVEMSSYVKAARKAEVTFKAKIWSGVSVSEVGVCFGVTTSPSTDGKHHAGTLSEEGVVTVTLSNFDVDTQYYLRAYVRDGEHIAYGEVIPMIIKLSPPTLSSVIVSSVEASAALFSSSVTNNGGDSVLEVGFYYSTEETVDPETSYKINQPYSDAAFGLQAKELVANTKYYVKAFAVNSAGTGYSQVADFTTSAAAPTVSTLGATDVTESGALLSGNVLSDNGAEITERGFVWVKGADAPTTASTKVKVDGAKGEYSATLTDMEPNQKYSFRAYAINAKGTAYGEVVSFTTVAGAPTLSATKVTGITETSATFTSKVTSDGGAVISEVGFYYSKEENVNVETAQKVSESFSSDNFTLLVTGLEVGTGYYVKAFTKNSVGEAYSAVVSFKTVSTAPFVTTKGFLNVTATSAELSGEVEHDNGEQITERGFLWLKGLVDPTDSSAKLKAEGTLGEYTSVLTGLDPNQSYSYRAYATNSKGTAFGGVKNFKTNAAMPEVKIQRIFEITSTTAEINGKVTYDGGETPSEAGFLYGTSSNLDPASAKQVVASSIDKDGAYYYNLAGLKRATQYYIKPYATNSAGTAYSEIEMFKTLAELPSVMTSEVTNITETSANCGGIITDDGGEILSKGIVWSRMPNPTIDLSTKTEVTGSSSSFIGTITGLRSGLPYYVRAYVTNSIGTVYGEQKQFYAAGEIQAVQLEPANSFIISSPDYYSFCIVKGSSSESVVAVSSVEVLWESFGTDETPEVGSLISSVSFEGDLIFFDVADPYREGNAVIAVRDDYGNISWSWHIWLTDQPEEQVYYNNAGTMMDRNLGATSAIPGDVGALGLLYQWGRKDPFLGLSSISSDIEAQSTITWPSTVSSTSTTGTIAYATANPTTFITCNSNNRDWYYTSSVSTDNSRWTISDSPKSIYDPCPSGWRVPYGGDYGVWSKAVGSSSYFVDYPYDSANEGMNFSGKFGSDQTIWYPALGHRYYEDGALSDVCSGCYWSVTPLAYNECYLYFNYNGHVAPSYGTYRANGFGIRCQKEGTGGGKYYNDFSTSGARSLSDTGTANSYIVSSAGTYSVPTVKGNSSESVGPVASAEVLWESFGTDERVVKGNLVSGVRYENGRVYFKTSDLYRKGNAVIAVKDAFGTILWSWHIWLTDQPQEQVYYNNSGTMMDRNLGATSATPGDVGALGLLYQWGRKDPFLGSSWRDSDREAKSTITWPSAVESDSSTGTVEYVTSHPTTYVTAYSALRYDWHYSSYDDTLWQSDKTIYDPCPAGWRVPDGGINGVWSNALGSSSYFNDYPYDSTNEGMNFSGKFGSSSIIWYPASGCRDRYYGTLDDVGNDGYYWSVTPSSPYAYDLNISYYGSVNPSYGTYRANGCAVRCVREID